MLGKVKDTYPFKVLIYYTQEKDFQLLKPYERAGFELIPLFVSKPKRVLNRLSGKEFFKPMILPFSDVLYPAVFDFPFELSRNKVFWVPDMQEKFYPSFFPEAEVSRRDLWYRRLIKEQVNVVFSSHSGRQHFMQFYPEAHENKLHVYRFATSVTRQSFSLKPLEELKHKYQFQAEFIICPNVLARSKNHTVVIEAAAQLSNQGIRPFILFTGNEYDGNKRDYPDSLKAKVLEYGLSNVHFLGLIPREDQLSLMVHAKAVLQPSLFEGWSTSVEEAKSLNKWLICSDIEVLKEQVDSGVIFFEAHSPESLALAIERLLVEEPNAKHEPYTQQQLLAGETFVQLMKQITG